MSILSRKMYFACSAEIFLSEIIVENQKCTISVVFFSVYTSKGFIPFRNRVIPNADHWSEVRNLTHHQIIVSVLHLPAGASKREQSLFLLTNQ